MFPNTVTGQVTGTGAAINVVVGFLPDSVELIHRTSGARLNWNRASLTTYLTAATGVITALTGANSIVVFEGPTGAGFTIPINATVNINTNIIDYNITRTGPGGA